MNKNTTNKVWFALGYALIASLLIFIFKLQIFSLVVNPKEWKIYYKLIWCFSFGLFGFSVLVVKLVIKAIKEKKDDNDPRRTYWLFYPPLLLMTSTAVFSALSMSFESMLAAYFGISACLSFFVGFYIDSLWQVASKLIDKT